MKVKELIQILKKQNPELIVGLYNEGELEEDSLIFYEGDLYENRCT